LVFGFALDLAAVAIDVGRPVEALVLAGEPPPWLLAANAPPVRANTKATKAMTVLGVRCLRIAENIAYLSSSESNVGALSATHAGFEMQQE
jgi:hypothetical protein